MSTPYLDEHFLEVPDVYPTMYVLRGHLAYIPLSFQDTYRRVRTNYKNIRYEHIYRNNKRVRSGRTTFNYFLGKLVVENIRQHDAGIYMTGDRNNSIGVFTVKGII